jgi:hypothetical protein
LAPGASGLSSLTMDNSGTTAQVIVSGGSQTISVNMTLAAGLSISPAAGTTLAISGNIGESTPGAGGLALDGLGELVLAGSST